MQNGCKSRRFRSRGCSVSRPADHVSPESNAGTRDIAPQDIQLLVPYIELLHVRALEAGPSQAKYLQIVAEDGPDDTRCNMRRKGMYSAAVRASRRPARRSARGNLRTAKLKAWARHHSRRQPDRAAGPAQGDCSCFPATMAVGNQRRQASPRPEKQQIEVARVTPAEQNARAMNRQCDAGIASKIASRIHAEIVERNAATCPAR